VSDELHSWAIAKEDLKSALGDGALAEKAGPPAPWVIELEAGKHAKLLLDEALAYAETLSAYKGVLCHVREDDLYKHIRGQKKVWQDLANNIQRLIEDL